jgi:nicotinate phosphoribosyltransferase
LLVDTYDTARGVERAIDVAREMRAGGSELLGIRIDSGDLAALSRQAREAFDAAGFPGVQILASGGLDELSIDELVRAGAPIDGFGVGTALGVSADAPSLEAVYKLVAFEGRPVVKTSVGKETMPCAKQVWRDPSFVHDDVLARADEPGPSASHEPLLVEVMRDGKRTDAGRASLADASAVFERGWAALPDAVKDLRSPQCRDAAPSAELQRVTAETRARFNPGVR